MQRRVLLGSAQVFQTKTDDTKFTMHFERLVTRFTITLPSIQNLHLINFDATPHSSPCVLLGSNPTLALIEFKGLRCRHEPIQTRPPLHRPDVVLKDCALERRTQPVCMQGSSTAVLSKKMATFV